MFIGNSIINIADISFEESNHPLVLSNLGSSFDL